MFHSEETFWLGIVTSPPPPPRIQTICSCSAASICSTLYLSEAFFQGTEFDGGMHLNDSVSLCIDTMPLCRGTRIKEMSRGTEDSLKVTVVWPRCVHSSRVQLDVNMALRLISCSAGSLTLKQKPLLTLPSRSRKPKFYHMFRSEVLNLLSHWVGSGSRLELWENSGPGFLFFPQ